MERKSNEDLVYSVSFQELPSEIFFYHIFPYMDLKDLLSFSVVNSLFHMISFCDHAWKVKLYDLFGIDRVNEIKKVLFNETNSFNMFKQLWRIIPIIQIEYTSIYSCYDNFLKSERSDEKEIFLNKLREFFPEFSGRVSMDKFKKVCRTIQRLLPQKQGDGSNSIVSYEGEMADGKRDGVGILKFKEEGIYVGEFSNHLFHGKGEIYFKRDGKAISKENRFVGIFKSGMRHGEGREYEGGELRYSGNFKENKKHGKGKYHYRDGSFYDGEFFEGRAKGQGTYIYRELGIMYKGQFDNDKRNGFGVFSYPDNSKYVGYFRDSRFCGNGKLRSNKRNIVFDGIWVFNSDEDRYFKGSILKMDTGEKISGKWINGVNQKSLDTTFHIGYFCQSCNECPIFGGIRYVCKQCIEFYICENCYKKGRHKNHEMFAVDLFQINDNLNHCKSSNQDIF